MGSDVNKFYFRLVLLGSNGTGKTSILNRFLFKKFEEKHKPTVEDLFTKEFDLGSIEIKVDFLDTSGSMQFPAMRRLSITNGDAFMIVYALDDENSFEVLKMCINEIQEIRKNDYQEIPIVFVGNKSDLPREQRKVPKELVSNYVYYELPRLRTKVIECSCRENTNIESIFRAYLGLARVSISPMGYGTTGATSTAMGLGGGHAQMATISGSGTGSGRNSHNSSAKKRPSSAAGGDPAGSTTATTNQTSGMAGMGHSTCSSPAASARHTSGSSFRVALGVRKSCDASIITSMRRISLSSAKNSREQLEATQEVPADRNDKQKHNNSATDHRADSGASEPNDVDEQDDDYLHDDPTDSNNNNNNNNNSNTRLQKQPQKSSIESILKAAIQNSQSNNKLHVNHEAKPRSRSLIWRPHRKSSQTSANDNKSECRIS